MCTAMKTSSPTFPFKFFRQVENIFKIQNIALMLVVFQSVNCLHTVVFVCPSHPTDCVVKDC